MLRKMDLESFFISDIYNKETLMQVMINTSLVYIVTKYKYTSNVGSVAKPIAQYNMYHFICTVVEVYVVCLFLTRCRY